MNNQVIGKSHAKIIFMGEHSVVYGKPAIALPISSVNLVANMEPINHGQLIQNKYFIGEINKMPSNLLGIQRLIQNLLIKFNQTDANFLLKIESQIPSERGMGSSAASSIAITKAMYKYFNVNLDYNELMKVSDIEETITHGNPSGLDTATAGSNKPVWFMHGIKTQNIPLNIYGSMVIADTGIKGRTDIAVNSVRQKMTNSTNKAQKLIDDLGELTQQAKNDFTKNNMNHLGKVMNQAQIRLEKLQVSSDELNHLTQIARSNGALGAKLTGSGLGGCIIALAKNKRDATYISEQLLKAGAVNTWIQSFNNNGGNYVDF